MEIADLQHAFRAMDRVLRPGSVSIHRIAPLHYYQMFRSRDVIHWNSLLYLT